MVKLNFQLLVVLLVFGVSLKTAWSLKCYQCSKLIEAECKDSTTGKMQTLDCPDSESCVTIVVPAPVLLGEAGQKAKGRSCGARGLCSNIPQEYDCFECQTDLCND